jgi:hypothetical protein
MKVRWGRWSPLAGIVAVAGIVLAFALTTSSPSTTDSDAKIAAYFGKHAHHSRHQIGFVVGVIGIMFLLWFFLQLRARIAATEATPRLAALAWGGGAVSGALWLSSFAFFSGPGYAADDTSKFSLDPNTFRLTSSIGYELWVAAIMVGALVVWAASAAALRSGLFPRWFAWVGVVAGVVQLFAVVFIPVFVYWGWIVLAAILLSVRKAARPAAS